MCAALLSLHRAYPPLSLVQVYAPAHLPFALFYFTSGQSFNRASRYWANYAVPHLARALDPRATGFKLGDTALVPIAKAAHTARSWGSDWVKPEDEVLCAGVPCASEADIFEALGLAYVPAHMRNVQGGDSKNY